jgi:hypothetical protein
MEYNPSLMSIRIKHEDYFLNHVRFVLSDSGRMPTSSFKNDFPLISTNETLQSLLLNNYILAYIRDVVVAKDIDDLGMNFFFI